MHKSDYNHRFKDFKISYICPQNASTKEIKKRKSVQGSDYGLLHYPSTDWATRKIINLCTKKLLLKSHFRRLFQKEVRHIMEVSHSPLNAKPNAVSKPTPIVIERGGGWEVVAYQIIVVLCTTAVIIKTKELIFTYLCCRALHSL